MQGSSLNLTTVISVISLVIGSLAFLMSILNYRRDRARVAVKLQWNAETVYVRGPRSPSRHASLTSTSLMKGAGPSSLLS